MDGYIYQYTRENLKYLELLSREYPTMQSVCTEIINLQAILNLPKGTEYFMSDIHGEYEAFAHILNNCAGVIREKVDRIFSSRLTDEECAEICTLIYYPEQKIKITKNSGIDLDQWYKTNLYYLIDVCKIVSSKYTRSKVRKALPKEFGYIIDELLHSEDGDINQELYHSKIIDTIISIRNADEFICALASLIKKLAVDRLHIVGDIFDRGPNPDKIMDLLMEHHSVDIQWGNHDILWMGGACGNEVCVATIVKLCAAFNNLEVLEDGYGINLRPLAIFASEIYKDYSSSLADAIHKAISIIMFKLEAGIINRNPEFEMENRILLNKIDYNNQTILIEGKYYPLQNTFFPTIDENGPFALTKQEQEIIDGLVHSFTESERLQKHVEFLYEKGSMYKCFNQNLLFHGCIPMDENGELLSVSVNGVSAKGKQLMDLCEKTARKAYFGKSKRSIDFMWYLWCGRKSPLFGREKMTTFERLFIEDKTSWDEKKNPYYKHYLKEEVCIMLLKEFGLNGEISHVINGHVPVKTKDGESPIKANGRLIVIDGGFCKAYHPRTGIAGYTLVFNSREMRIISHQPFSSTEKAVEQNIDIKSTSTKFQTLMSRIMVMDTDIGNEISNKIFDLTLLLNAYRDGHLIPRKD